MDDTQLRKDVFAWYGGASYAAQCFEVELTTLLLLAHRVGHPSAVPTELDAVEVKLSKLARGQLLVELKKQFAIDPDSRRS